MFETFLDALVAAKDGPGLATAINRELDKEKDPERLRKYAGLALQLNQSSTAQKAYEKLLSLKANDQDALKSLGSLEFQQGKHAQAEQYLARYLARGQGDYRSNYYYGEVLIRARKRSAALMYYQRALRQIEESTPKPFAMRLVEAQLLNRVGRIEESIAAFESLLKQWPQDKNLRADYAAMLIDRGRYKDARRILSLP